MYLRNQSGTTIREKELGKVPWLEGDGEQVLLVRELALWKLTTMGAKGIEAMSNAIEESDYGYIRGPAVWGLVERLGNLAAIEPLMRALNEGDVSPAVIEGLGILKERRAFEKILAALSVSSTQSSAVYALGMMGDSRAVEPLLNELKKNKSMGIVRALGRLRDPRAVEPLINILMQEIETIDSLTKKTNFSYTTFRILDPVTEALGAIQDPRAVEPLIELLRLGLVVMTKFEETSYSRDIIKSAAGALGALRDPRAVEPLIKVLNHTIKARADWVSVYPAGALGKIKDSRATQPLLDALRSSARNENTAEIAEALGDLGETRAVEPLISLLRRIPPFYKTKVSVALKKITGKDFGEDPEAWQTWWEQNNKPAPSNLLFRIAFLSGIAMLGAKYSVLSDIKATGL